jgi:hypothetical protein
MADFLEIYKVSSMMSTIMETEQKHTLSLKRWSENKEYLCLREFQNYRTLVKNAKREKK